MNSGIPGPPSQPPHDPQRGDLPSSADEPTQLSPLQPGHGPESPQGDHPGPQSPASPYGAPGPYGADEAPTVHEAQFGSQPYPYGSQGQQPGPFGSQGQQGPPDQPYGSPAQPYGPPAPPSPDAGGPSYGSQPAPTLHDSQFGSQPQPQYGLPVNDQSYGPGGDQPYGPPADQPYGPPADQPYGPPTDQPYGSPPPGSAAMGPPPPGGSGPQFAAGAAPGQFGPTQTRKKKSNKPLIISLISVSVVVVLVIVGIVVVNTVNRNQYGPDRVAQEYLSALESGDLEQASSLAPPVIPNNAAESLLDARFFNASPDKFENAQIENTSVEGDNATILASYQVADQSFELTLQATKDGKQGLFFDNWVLTGPTLSTITLAVPNGLTSTLNGEALELEDSGGSPVEFAVYPGTYEVGVESSDFVEATGDSATVAFADSETPAPTALSVDASPTQALTDEVQTQVDQKVDECAEETEVLTERENGCPFVFVAGSEVAEDAENVRIEVKSKPSVEVVLSDPTQATFYTTSDGSWNFRADSKEHSGGEWYGVRDVNFTMSGSITIDGDTVTLEFNDF